MSSSSQSAFLVGKALAWMRGHLAEWSLLMVRKVHELLQGHEISRDQNIYASRADNRAIAALMWQGPVDLPSGVLIPLILLGAAMATATRQHSAIVLLFLATQVVFVLAFFIATRYRLALCAAAIPYAAYGIVSLQRRLLVSPRSALPWVVLLAGFMVLCNSNKLHAFEGRVPFEHSHLADALASFGMRDRAFESLRAALRLDPMYGPAHFQLAGYYREQGELAMAEGHYLAGLRAAPMAYPARHEYAELLLALGRAYDATRELKRVWMDVPGAEIRARLCHAMSLAGLSEPLTQADRCETEPRLEGKATP